MSIIGKIHEISFYGLLATIYSLATKLITFQSLYFDAFHPSGYIGIFCIYLFWSTILFLPISILAGFSTKYGKEKGNGLTFTSNQVIVIMFAHIGEELLGLILTPIWFLRDVFSRNLRYSDQIFDYITYFIEITYIIIGLLLL